ncbi:hypothetical protein [Brevibacillus sp. MER 51]|uniref:hypothetical protein n=1 Tax=Brevibacillus sp. MER 51 TaxID=2939560 RepID=UPI0020411F5F|nr:hypothetical protein [Brevibacillus sp. MER 51]MCM3144344.1 hypothetical protein [Brevibacillus sp. MER 51]
MLFREGKSGSSLVIIPVNGMPIKSGKNSLPKVSAAEIETTSLLEPLSNKLDGHMDG